jgi:cell division protein ZapA
MNTPATKQLEVQIMGQSYLLACPPGGETALLDAVGKVDTAMCRIRDAGKVKARDRIAVLASLNLAFELSQRESEILAQTSFGVTEPAPFGDMAASMNDPAAQERAEELLRRLDQTLGNDGQLI